jgi:hypothetical protein
MNQSPSQDTDARKDGRNWLLTGVTGAATLSLGLLYGHNVPGFRAMFDDLGQQLPILTRAIVSVPTAAWIAVGASLSAVIVLKNLLLPARVCLLIDVVVLVGCGISVPLMIYALFLPLIVHVKSIK